jgi:hypothetical protein
LDNEKNELNTPKEIPMRLLAAAKLIGYASGLSMRQMGLIATGEFDPEKLNCFRIGKRGKFLVYQSEVNRFINRSISDKV